jgi:flagellar basal body P-ring formation protein FlgA
MFKPGFAFLGIALVGCLPAQAEDKFQTLESIYGFVKETIENNMNISGETEISVLPLDDQLKLAQCSKPLETFKTNNLIKAGRVSIGVHCGGEKKWSIFVSALIKAYASVIVLAQPIQRGEIITRQHLASEKKEVSSTKGDFVTAFEQIENKQAARNLPAGAILGAKSVVEPAIIKRKDKVIIRSEQTAFSIQMSGIAMMDGIKGQVIKVKNESSGRIISGTVLEPGVVLVK